MTDSRRFYKHLAIILVLPVRGYFITRLGSTPSDASQSKQDLALPAALSRLPAEVQELILDYIYNLFLDELRLVRQLKASWKEYYSAIKVLAECLPRWRSVAIKKWLSTWATSESDWAEGTENNVRVITAGEGAFRLNLDLSPFRNLRTADLNFHTGFEYEKRSNSFALKTCVSELPPSLERLQVVASHGPDSEVFDLAKRCCPNLTELSIVRCSFFNNPTCKWWTGHPEEFHHSYMKDHNDVASTMDYAALVASQLRPLQHLQTLHIGDYFTHFGGIWNHRWNHKRHHPIEDRLYYFNPVMVHNGAHLLAMQADQDGPPINPNLPRPADRELWASHCPKCVEEYAIPTEVAERRTASLIASVVWSLHSISFASFVIDGRISSSSWEVSRSHKTPPMVDDTEVFQGSLGVPFQVGTHRSGDPADAQWWEPLQTTVVA